VAEPRVKIDFPGGNGTDFEWRGPDRLRFEADLRDGPCSMWFHFIVENPACDALRCELTNGKTALGWPYRPHVRPVFRHSGEAWRRVPPTVTDKDAGRFEFEVACDGRTTEVAFCYPYQLADWDSFFQSTLRPAGAEIIKIGRTGMGRDYFLCRLGGGPVVLWFAARAHAGETPGSYAMEGILAELARVREPDFTVIAAPFVDLDGVVEGMYGKNRPPLDFNRAWHRDDTRPEIKACREYIDALPTPPAIAVDLHAPTAYDSHYICHSSVHLDPERAESLQGLVAAIVADAAEDPATALDPAMTGDHPDWHPEGEQHTMVGHFKLAYGALAFSLESCYHMTHLGAVVDPEQWRKLGRLVARRVIFHAQERGNKAR